MNLLMRPIWYTLKMKNKDQTIAPRHNNRAVKYKWRGNVKQKLFMENYLNPESNTFANAYQSGIKAGFSPTYSKNITHLAPKWLSEYMEKVDFRPEHIKQGIQKIATGVIDSRSIDDTRLKAYELLMKIEGMEQGSTTTVNIVQPILGGESVKDDERLKVDVDQH